MDGGLGAERALLGQKVKESGGGLGQTNQEKEQYQVRSCKSRMIPRVE